MIYLLLAETVEPTTFDQWIDVVSDFASLKNFILSVSGLTLISILLKVRGVYKWVKTPTGQDQMFNLFEKWLGKIMNNPELVSNLIQTLSTVPVVKQFIGQIQAKLDRYDLELEERILNLQAKVDNDVFKSPQDRQNAIILLDKLRAKLSDDSENTQSSE